SAGCITGMSISWPPIASISSRTICSTLRWTRHPAGRNVHRPEASWRIMPARTSSLCDSASASAGGSFTVGRKYELRRVTGSAYWSGPRSPGAPRRWARPSDAGEAAALGRRGLLVEAHLLRLGQVGAGVAARRGLGLELRDPLRGHLVGLLLLDTAKPVGALRGLLLLELGGPALERAIDLHEELVHAA